MLITLQHECIPVVKEHEVCCIKCGIVLDTVQESPYGETLAYHGLDLLMIQTSFSQLKYWKSNSNKEIKHKQDVLGNLLKITKEYGLPNKIAYETMRRLLKKNRGMYSFRLQIRELLEVINTDYRLFMISRKIKQRYEMALNI